MRYFRVIVEERENDRWIAWFAECPDQIANSHCIDSAIVTLLDRIAPGVFKEEKIKFDLSKLKRVTEAIRPGHFEVDVPLHDNRSVLIDAA